MRETERVRETERDGESQKTQTQTNSKTESEKLQLQAGSATEPQGILHSSITWSEHNPEVRTGGAVCLLYAGQQWLANTKRPGLSQLPGYGDLLRS